MTFSSDETPEDLPIGSDTFSRLSQAESLHDLRVLVNALPDERTRPAVLFLVRRHKEMELGWDSEAFRRWEEG